MAYSLKEINDAVRSDPKGFAEACDAAFAKKVDINRLGNNPTKLTVEDVEALYRKILVHK